MKNITLVLCLLLSACNLSDQKPIDDKKEDVTKDSVSSDQGMDLPKSLDMENNDLRSPDFSNADLPSNDTSVDLRVDLSETDVGSDMNPNSSCMQDGCPVGKICTESGCLSSCAGIRRCELGFACKNDLCFPSCTGDADCKPGVCDVSQTVATCDQNTRPKSKGQCEVCISDSECMDNFKCIPLNSGTTFHGNYCLQIDQGNCQKPFQSRITKPSLNGLAKNTYCGINETVSTCEAILSFGKNCDNGNGQPDETQCDSDEGFCILHNNQFWACSYACTSIKACYSAAECTNSFCEITPKQKP